MTFRLPPSPFRPRRAFTLVEAITTLVVLAIVAGAASRIIYQTFGALNDASTRTDMQNQLAAAMERISIELRTIQIKSGSNPATPDITACTAPSISFNNTAGAARTVALSGSNLQITGNAASTQTIASGITSFTIQTYDTSNAALPASPTAGQIATIRRIQVTITATSGSMTETLRSKFFVRCMALGSGAS
jgi:prepilin-type N-terminal cleavage/methylation domain-containing protein